MLSKKRVKPPCGKVVPLIYTQYNNIFEVINLYIIIKILLMK